MEDKYVDSVSGVVDDIVALACALNLSLLNHPHRSEILMMVEIETGTEVKDWTDEEFVRSYLEKYLLS